MSIRKRKLRNGAVCYEVRWSEDAKRFSRSFVRKIDAEKFHHQKQVDLENLTLHQGWYRNFDEVALKWLEFHNQQTLAVGTLIRSNQIVRKVLIPRFGKLKLKEILPSLIEPWLLEMRKSGRAPNGINRFLQIIKSILNHEVRMARIPYNPIGSFRLMRGSLKEFVAWDMAQAEQFLKWAELKYQNRNPWVYRVYTLALNTGLRAGEIWGLRWSDILWTDKLIKIEQVCDKNTRELKIGTKGRRLRFVPLTNSLKKVLEDQRLKYGIGNSKLVFECLGDSARPHDHRNFMRDFWAKDIELVVKELGLQPMRFHDLRHTAATLMLQGGLDVVEVQQILGHQSVTTTMRYVHLIGNRSAKRAAEIFEVGKAQNQKTTIPKISAFSEECGQVLKATDIN